MKTNYINLVTTINDGDKYTTNLLQFTSTPGIVVAEFNAEQAMRDAVQEYLETSEAKKILEYNNYDFNWGDAILNLPDEIWNKHGLHPIKNNAVITVNVNHDENMAPEQPE